MRDAVLQADSVEVLAVGCVEVEEAEPSRALNFGERRVGQGSLVEFIRVQIPIRVGLRSSSRQHNRHTDENLHTDEDRLTESLSFKTEFDIQTAHPTGVRLGAVRSLFDRFPLGCGRPSGVRRRHWLISVANA